jgi:hypothetical protein
MSQALLATGKPIVFEAATLGDTRVMPWLWSPPVANLWRTTGDISPSYSRMLSIFTSNSQLAQYAGPGHWNDADMLEVGTGAFSTLAAPASAGDTNVKVASTSRAVAGSALRIGTVAGGDMESGVIESVGTAGADGTGITLAKPLTRAHPSGTAIGKSGMSLTESRTHFSLWSMMAAPLISGTDVVNIADENLAVLTNRDVLAVDQDPLGIQAGAVTDADSHWTLRKPLSDGDTAVALFNANSSAWPAPGASLASLGLDPGTTYLAKDLWTKAISRVSGALDATALPAHATTVLRLTTRGPQITVPAGPIIAQATEPTGVPVSYGASAEDAFGGAIATVCTPPSGSTFPIGPTRVTCTATDAAGRSDSASFDVTVLAPEHPLAVSGTVPATLSIVLGGPAAFGAFTPGVARDYSASTSAAVVSTAGDAGLSVADGGTSAGHLLNGAFALPSALHAGATSPGGTSTGDGEVGASTPLLNYSAPVSNDPVTLSFSQHIGATDPLRTGSYSKTLTFTLSTTAP